MKDVRRIRSIYTSRPSRGVIVCDLRNLRDRSRPRGNSLENKPPRARGSGDNRVEHGVPCERASSDRGKPIFSLVLQGEFNIQALSAATTTAMVLALARTRPHVSVCQNHRRGVSCCN